MYYISCKNISRTAEHHLEVEIVNIKTIQLGNTLNSLTAAATPANPKKGLYGGQAVDMIILVQRKERGEVVENVRSAAQIAPNNCSFDGNRGFFWSTSPTRSRQHAHEDTPTHHPTMFLNFIHIAF